VRGSDSGSEGVGVMEWEWEQGRYRSCLVCVADQWPMRHVAPCCLLADGWRFVIRDRSSESERPP
jgi:hypothetical protein